MNRTKISEVINVGVKNASDATGTKVELTPDHTLTGWRQLESPSQIMATWNTSYRMNQAGASQNQTTLVPGAHGLCQAFAR